MDFIVKCKTKKDYKIRLINKTVNDIHNCICEYTDTNNKDFLDYINKYVNNFIINLDRINKEL